MPARPVINSEQVFCMINLDHPGTREDLLLPGPADLPVALGHQLLDSLMRLHTQAQQLAGALAALDPQRWEGWTLGIRDEAWRQHISLPSGRPHATAGAVYSCLSHEHGGDGRDTWQLAGLLVVPQVVLLMADELNGAKEDLEVVLSRCRQALGRKLGVTDVLHRLSRYPGTTPDRVRGFLAQVGRGRLHLRHCTRRIVVVHDRPASISLSWMRARRSIRKITPEACMEKLLAIREKKGDSPGIAAQIAQLNHLGVQEAGLLRQVQTVSHPSVKGTVSWPNGSRSELGYLSMPALIASDHSSGSSGRLPPHSRPPASPPDVQRRSRSDARLSEAPFLPSIRVFLSRPRSAQQSGTTPTR